MPALQPTQCLVSHSHSGTPCAFWAIEKLNVAGQLRFVYVFMKSVYRLEVARCFLCLELHALDSKGLLKFPPTQFWQSKFCEDDKMKEIRPLTLLRIVKSTDLFLLLSCVWLQSSTYPSLRRSRSSQRSRVAHICKAVSR